MTVTRYALALALAACATPAGAAEQKPAPPTKAVTRPAGKPLDPNPGKALHEEMMKAAAVGPMHQLLKTNLAGSWTVVAKSFANADKPSESTGTAEMAPILGDRFIVETFNGQMMGKPMQGHGMIGYDNMRSQFVMVWADSMGTELPKFTGTWDEKTKTITLTGSTWSITQRKDVTMRELLKLESDKKHTVELWVPGADGKDMKLMEITYTRK